MARAGQSVNQSPRPAQYAWSSGAYSGRLSDFLDALSEAPEPAELLRHLIHKPLFAPAPRAVACGMISEEAELVELGSYGLTQPHDFVERQSVWKTIPPFIDFATEIPIRRSVEEMRDAFRSGGIRVTPEPWARSILLQPVHGARGVPLGAFIFIFDVESSDPIDPLIAPHDLHSVLVLAMRSTPFQVALKQAMSSSNLDLLLTDRELSCLKLAARGYTNKDIANQLRISAGTVKLALGKVFAKLGVSKRSHAIETAKKAGLI